MKRFLTRYTGGVGTAPYPSYPDGSADFRTGPGYLTGLLPLDPTVGFSISFWWIFDAGPVANEMLLGQLVDQNGTAGDQFRYAYENGLGVSRNLFWATDTSFASTGGGGDHVGAPWRFQHFSYDPSNPVNPTIRQSVNGGNFAVSGSMTALLRPATGGTQFWVGNGPATAGWEGFKGRIDALAIHRGVLTLAEVQTLYNGGSGYDLPWQVPAGSISKPLIAWYPFDEPSGSSLWRDAAGGHNLSATGTVNSGNPRNS